MSTPDTGGGTASHLNNPIGAEATVRAADPVFTQRTLNQGLRDSAGNPLEINFTEKFILTRPRTTVVKQAQKTFDSNSVKALFNLGPLDTAAAQPNGNTNSVQANGSSNLANTSMPAPTPHRPLVASDFAL